MQAAVFHQGLHHLAADVVVGEFEDTAVLQREAVVDRCPLHQRSVDALAVAVGTTRLEVRWWVVGVVVECHQPASGAKQAADGAELGAQFVAVAGVVEQVAGEHQVCLGLQRQCTGVAHPVVDPEGMAPFLLPCQLDHVGRQVDPQHLRGPKLLEQTRVVALAAAQIQY